MFSNNDRVFFPLVSAPLHAFYVFSVKPWIILNAVYQPFMKTTFSMYFWVFMIIFSLLKGKRSITSLFFVNSPTFGAGIVSNCTPRNVTSSWFRATGLGVLFSADWTLLDHKRLYGIISNQNPVNVAHTQKIRACRQLDSFSSFWIYEKNNVDIWPPRWDFAAAGKELNAALSWISLFETSWSNKYRYFFQKMKLSLNKSANSAHSCYYSLIKAFLWSFESDPTTIRRLSVHRSKT